MPVASVEELAEQVRALLVRTGDAVLARQVLLQVQASSAAAGMEFAAAGDVDACSSHANAALVVRIEGTTDPAFSGAFVRAGSHLGAPCFKSASGKWLFRADGSWVLASDLPSECGATLRRWTSKSVCSTAGSMDDDDGEALCFIDSEDGCLPTGTRRWKDPKTGACGEVRATVEVPPSPPHTHPTRTSYTGLLYHGTLTELASP